MVTIKNVAFAGAAGNLGPAILEALTASQKFNITILQRPTSKSTYPSSVKVVKVDFESVSDLTSALKGQDAVISTVTVPAGNAQTNLLEAAIAAKVYRFIPSEFGSDLTQPKVSQLPVFQEKIVLAKKLEEVSKTSDITYTLIRNNAFLDWGLKVNFIANLSDPVVYDSGDEVFGATTLATVGQAVVGVLSKPEETKNRAVLVREYTLTLNKVFAAAKQIWPEKNLSPKSVPSADVLSKSMEELTTGNIGPTTFVSQIIVALFGKGYAYSFEKNDNELLGIKEKSESDLVALWKSLN